VAFNICSCVCVCEPANNCDLASSLWYLVSTVVFMLMNQPTRVYSYAGEMLSETELECPLPPSPLSTNSSSAVYTWNISVSNDGQTYSNHLQLTVYDSRCLDCQCAGECRQKVNSLITFTSGVLFYKGYNVGTLGHVTHTEL